MNASKLFVASIMVAAVSAAFTSTVWADENQPLSRAEVKAAVLQARADGTLPPAGDAAEQDPAPKFGIERTRAELRAEALEASRLGQLMRGEAVEPIVQASDSTLTREEVRSEVGVARLRGELIPSDEGFGPIERVAKTPRVATNVAADAGR